MISLRKLGYGDHVDEMPDHLHNAIEEFSSRDVITTSLDTTTATWETRNFDTWENEAGNVWDDT